MGSRGPAPKRESQRRRRNKPETPIKKGQGAARVPVPRADPDWHDVAKRWYQSLAKSGQAAYYEPSDWALAYVTAESMSRDLKPRVVSVTMAGDVIKASLPISGTSLAAYLKAMTGLLVTEVDRRRAGLELDISHRLTGKGGDGGEAAGVSWLDAARSRRSG